MELKPNNTPIVKPTPEEIKEWRKEHAGELMPENKVAIMPDGTVVTVGDKSPEEIKDFKEGYNDQQRGLNK